MPVIVAARFVRIVEVKVSPSIATDHRVIVNTGTDTITFTLDELEHINKVVAAHFADLAEPLPDFPGDIPSLAEQESQEV